MGREVIGGAAAIVIGAGYLWMSLQVRASALADTVGPAGFPRALGVLMVGLGIVLCVQGLLASRAKPAAVAADAGEPAADEGERNGLAGIVRAAGFLGLGILYLLVVRTIGYVPAVAGLIIAAALYGGIPVSWRVFAIGVAGALVYWLLFVLLLGVPLPGGFLADLL